MSKIPKNGIHFVLAVLAALLVVGRTFYCYKLQGTGGECSYWLSVLCGITALILTTAVWRFVTNIDEEAGD